MDRKAFKQRMQNLKSYRDNNPGKGYWDWRNSLPDNLKYTDDTEYDMYGAYKSGVQPEYIEEDNSYHLPTRDPNTGKILKKSIHPTFWKGLTEDAKLGYDAYFVGDEVYTKNKYEEPIQAFADGGEIKRSDITDNNTYEVELPEVIITPDEQSKALLKMSQKAIPDKRLRHSLFKEANIAGSNKSSNYKFNKIIDLAIKSGNPNVVDNDNTRPYYNPINNTSYLPVYKDDTYLSYLSELTHAYQRKYNGIINMLDLPSDVKIKGKDRYATQNTTEYNAHQIIQPMMREYLDSDMTFEQLQDSINKKIGRYEDGGEIPPKRRGGYDKQGNIVVPVTNENGIQNITTPQVTITPKDNIDLSTSIDRGRRVVGDIGREVLSNTTPFGDIESAVYAYDAIKNKDWLGMGLAALSVLPFIPNAKKLKNTISIPPVKRTFA